MADAQTQSSALQGVEFEGGDFASLLNKEFKPQTDEAKSAVESAVRPVTSSVAPSRWKRSAIARPIPRPPPVTKTVLPCIANG